MAEKTRERRGRKLLLTLLVVGVIGSLAGFGTFSAFSSTTSNDNNSFEAGTVYIVDNDGGVAMYQVTNAAPGTSDVSCITVTYLGTLPAAVHLYANGISGALAPYVDLTVEEGTDSAPSFDSCANFTASSTVFSGTLAGFQTAYADWATGLATGGAWNQNDTHSYRFTVTLQDDNNANGETAPLSTGAHSFVWEAQNT
jgi:predicted ribosomally synthesized peptide with SipW-like signal peptide